MAFFGLDVNRKQCEIKDPLTSLLHLSQACLANPDVKGKVVLKLISKGKDPMNVAVLSENQECLALNLYVDPMEVKFQCVGDSNVRNSHYTAKFELCDSI